MATRRKKVLAATAVLCSVILAGAYVAYHNGTFGPAPTPSAMGGSKFKQISTALHEYHSTVDQPVSDQSENDK